MGREWVGEWAESWCESEEWAENGQRHDILVVSSATPGREWCENEKWVEDPVRLQQPKSADRLSILNNITTSSLTFTCHAAVTTSLALSNCTTPRFPSHGPNLVARARVPWAPEPLPHARLDPGPPPVLAPVASPSLSECLIAHHYAKNWPEICIWSTLYLHFSTKSYSFSSPLAVRLMKFFNISNAKSPKSSRPASPSPSSINAPQTNRNDSLNIYNLSLADSDLAHPVASPENDLCPLISPAYEDVPMWNILPSYQLYQSTFSKSIQPSNEDPKFDPPTYEVASPGTSPVSPLGSGSSSGGLTTGGYFPVVPPSPQNQQPQPPAPAAVDQTPTRWENSILGNSHRLKKLVDINSTIANKLKIDVQITDKPCQRGVRPSIIDPQAYEYQQGDSIHGFITITNTSTQPFPFDMFSVVFEGKITVMGDAASENKRPILFYKFVNMFDYAASWTPADLDTETMNDKDKIDSFDGTSLRMSTQKIFEPQITYKKFFSFKIPDKLLDCACEMHNLSTHCQLFPTIGLERDEFLKKLRKLRATNRAKNFPTSGATTPPVTVPVNKRKQGIDGILNKRIKDLCFPDSAISYSVEARMVGKASDYEKYMPHQETDEFVIVNEASSFIRVIPREMLTHEFDPILLKKESQLIFKNLVSRVHEKIDLGNDLLNNRSVSPSVELNSEQINVVRSKSLSKRRQLYVELVQRLYRSIDYVSAGDMYETFVPIKKKTLGTTSKVIGMLNIKTPKTEYIAKYIPPFKFERFRTFPDDANSTRINVPITVNFTLTNSPNTKVVKPPEIRSVSAELLVTTYRSRKYPLPIELFDDLKFRNQNVENDNIETYLINPFKKYLEKVTSLSTKLGYEVLNIDTQFIMDLKSIANLSVKYNCLKIEKVKPISKLGLGNWGEPVSSRKLNGDHDEYTFSKKIDLSVDLQNLQLKDLMNLSHEDLSSEAYTLVPSFQSCIIGRYYTLKVLVKLQNHDVVIIKVPISIQL